MILTSDEKELFERTEQSGAEKTIEQERKRREERRRREKRKEKDRAIMYIVCMDVSACVYPAWKRLSGRTPPPDQCILRVRKSECPLPRERRGCSRSVECHLIGDLVPPQGKIVGVHALVGGRPERLVIIPREDEIRKRRLGCLTLCEGARLNEFEAHTALAATPPL